MKPLKIFVLSLTLFASCGAPQNNTKRNDQDSAAAKPAAAPEKQIPGTPGPGGTDSARPGGPEHNNPADSAR